MTSYVKNPETEYIEGQATLLLNTALTKLNPTDLKILMTNLTVLKPRGFLCFNSQKAGASSLQSQTVYYQISPNFA